MKESFINKLQKFINVGFTYADLLVLIDKQRDFLLTKNILEKTEPNELNALWYTLDWLEKYFSFAKEDGLIIGTANRSVALIFDQYSKSLNKNL